MFCKYFLKFSITIKNNNYVYIHFFFFLFPFDPFLSLNALSIELGSRINNKYYYIFFQKYFAYYFFCNVLKTGNMSFFFLKREGKWTRKVRPCLVGRKFSVFCIQTFRKQGKRV